MAEICQNVVKANRKGLLGKGGEVPALLSGPQDKDFSGDVSEEVKKNLRISRCTAGG